MTQESWAIVVGLLVMLVTSLVKNPSWNRTHKTVVFAAVSVLGAVGQLLIAGDLDLDRDNFWADLGTNVSIIVTTATMIYNLKFKETSANEKLESTKVL
ncbi:MAG TPA: hypothetical protein VJ742_12120 [Nitrososphaera sp.]|nr:hypothetical protein [Nitrososphaera sp.]